MIGNTKKQEFDYADGHNFINLDDVPHAQSPTSRAVIKIFFWSGLATLITIILITLYFGNGKIPLSFHLFFSLAAIAGVVISSTYFFASATKADNKFRKDSLSYINQKLGTAFEFNERFIFSGYTHSRDKRLRIVQLLFDTKNRKVLVISFFRKQCLVFVNDYNYIKGVEFSSNGGSITSGAIAVGSVLVPFRYTAKPDNEITVLLKDPDLVEVKRVWSLTNSEQVIAKYRQLGALLSS